MRPSVEPPGQGGHEILVAALAGHQPVEAVEDAGRAGPLAGQAAEAPLSTAASRLASGPLPRASARMNASPRSSSSTTS